MNRHKFKVGLIIILAWFMAISLLCVVYYKIKFLFKI